jgi:hypothetical protein
MHRHRDVAMLLNLRIWMWNLRRGYIVSLACLHSLMVVYHATQQEAFPTYDIPAGEEKAPEERVDASRTEQDLCIVPISLQETIVDMARTLIATGIAKPKRK